MAAKRQPVAKGGLWSSQAAPVSKETQQLLKVMMEESKLTNFQRRQLSDKMTKGHSLPVAVNPTTSQSQRPRQPSSAKKPLPKVMHAKHLAGGRRSKDDIDELCDGEETEEFRPSPGKFISAEEKRKLQNVMAYGEYGKNIDGKPRKKAPPPEKIKEKNVDRFDELLEEVEERKRFLEEMESIGQGKKYRTIINTEISQKVRELEVIDKKRSQELDLAIKEQNTSPDQGS